MLSDADIDRLGRAFADRTLPKAEWTHAAHWAAALWLLRRGQGDAFADMPPMIRAYNEATGGVNSDTEGYHETITIASLCAARAVLADHPAASLSQALAALLAGPLGRSDWPLTYWRRETLFTPHARRTWTEPDLSPLPWS